MRNINTRTPILRVLLLLSAMTGCGNERPPAGPAEARSCQASSQCPTGEECQAGVCVPAGLGPQNTCFGGICCDAEGPCVDRYEALCEAVGGCQCRILHAGGAVPVSGDSRLVVAQDELVEVQAVLSATFGDRLPAGPYGVTVDNGESFVVAEHQLVGTATPGAGRITVSFGNTVSCEADVLNLGSLPADGNLRVTLVDASTGAPVVGAQLIVDSDGDGQDDGVAAASDAQGVALTTVAPAHAYDLTVVAPGYDLLTILGVEPSRRELLLPLSPRPEAPVVGALSGLLDFAGYEAEVLDGRVLPFHVGLAATSFSLEALLDFDLGMLFGGEYPSWGCDTLPAPGCYAIEIPGLIDDVVPMWGGIVLSLATKPIKPFFETSGSPGERFLWTLAGEFESSDIASLFTTIMTPDSTLCTCDVSLVCDTSCSCDTDCQGSLAGRMLRAVSPLLRRGASGVRGNLLLEPAPYSDWLAHTTPTYGEDRAADARFPVLEGEGALSPSEPLARFTDLAMPTLPEDPVIPGSRLDGVVAMSGVLARGAGFVPLGLGAGFDCNGACPGAAAAPLAYDGRLEPTTLCDADAEELDDRCQPGVPERVLPGHMALFSAPPHDGLEGEAQRTVVVALPLDSLDFDSFRASGLVLEGDLDAEVDLEAEVFPAVPSLPAMGPSRELELPASDADLVRLSFDAGGRQWVIIGSGVSRGVVLPELPEGAVDPLTGEGLRLGVASLRYATPRGTAEVVGWGSGRLAQLLFEVTAFATRRAELPGAE